MTPMLAAARELACRAHAGQRYGDARYVQLLENVVALLAPYGETATVVGWLHDILEDTPVSAATIAERFGPLVAHAVGLVTDEPGSSRAERKAKTYAKLR